jgi:hypothetical protein
MDPLAAILAPDIFKKLMVGLCAKEVKKSSANLAALKLLPCK